MEDVQPVGEAISDCASTWVQDGGWTSHTERDQIIVLLVGGSKRTQKIDIKRAKVLAGTT